LKLAEWQKALLSLTYRQIQHAFNRAFETAKLPYSSTHVLRHTGATLFLNETGDALALKQMGNWADLDVALHYGQIMGSRARNALDKASRKLRLVKGKSDVEEAV
jgi:integrase